MFSMSRITLTGHRALIEYGVHIRTEALRVQWPVPASRRGQVCHADAIAGDDECLAVSPYRYAMSAPGADRRIPEPSLSAGGQSIRVVPDAARGA
jgi:hypothetical protein